MREMSVAEQRYQAVLAVISEGRTVTEVAFQYRVSRQTLHGWLSAPQLDEDYGTCKEAKAYGKGPYHQGQDPEYDWYRDSDSDGIVCE
jgi:hypothetical protein